MLVEALVCLAMNVYHESRNYPEAEQLAVAHVVLNRVADNKFPDTICAVVLQGGEERRHRCQFSWYCDGRSDTPFEEEAWEAAKQIAIAATLSNQDPTYGAVFYHAHYVAPYWAYHMVVAYADNAHIFYRRKS